jgi:hypothetical protein
MPVGPISLIADPRQFEPWLAALGKLTGSDDAQASIGPEMVRFIMGGLPAVRAPGGRGDDEPDEADLERLRQLSEASRRTARGLLATAATRKLPAEGRLAVLALIMLAAEAGIWDGPLGEAGWIRVLAAALERLDQDDLPGRLDIPAATWAALAAYLMHDSRPASGRPAEFQLYQNAATAVSHLFPDADDDLVAQYAQPLTNRHGNRIDPEAVSHVIELIVQEDPLAQAADALEGAHPDWHVHKHGDTLLHVDVSAGATFPKAAEAIDAIPAGAGAVGVLATGGTAGWSVAIRPGDGTLIHVERTPAGQFTWRQYRLGSLTTPTRIGRDPEVATRARISNGPLSQPFPAALQALAATGFDLASDPPSPCP